MEILFSQHALQQMFKRNILIKDVKELLPVAEIIKDYPDDKPYPSKLYLGYLNGVPLHIVVAFNESEKQIIIVTAYFPDNKLWTNDFKTKK
jgi:uncharacterized DUF497 family protein